jgi:hypothetical protein
VSYARLSDNKVSPRMVMVYGLTRLLLAVMGLIALALWVVSAGSPSIASKIFGEGLGTTIGNVSTTTEVLIGLGILVAVGILFYVSRTLFGRLLILVAFAVTVGLAFLLPNPVGMVPATLLLLIVGGLTSMFLIMCSVVS